MLKIDLKKEGRHLYAPSAREVQVVDVPKFVFIMVDGVIEAGATPRTSPAFQEATSALYNLSFTLKFMSKRNPENPLDYTVMPLEGLWWSSEGEFDLNNPSGWCWTLMIRQPEHVTPAMFQTALEQSESKLRKKGEANAALARLRLERFREGLCLQIMHVGPYAQEPRTVERMKAFAQENGYLYRGKHHEIYLGDPRQVSPEKLQTILRQPVEKAG